MSSSITITESESLNDERGLLLQGVMDESSMSIDPIVLLETQHKRDNHRMMMGDAVSPMMSIPATQDGKSQ